MRRLANLCSMLAAASLLGGCATIEGAPRRVIDEPMTMGLVAKYPIDETIKKFSYPEDDYYKWTFREGLDRKQYRDMVVRLYMGAMDSRYGEFTAALSSERRQADFALDLAVLGFTGWASIAKASIVNNLSAVAAGFAGARGVVDKDLYFSKAIPALIAAMDADRFRARAAIEAELQKPAGDYPLQTAFGDLMGYEVASTLDGAITRITTEATQDRQAAHEELRAAIRSCQADADATPVVSRLSRYLRKLVHPDPPNTQAAGAAKLRLIAVEMQLPPEVIAAEDPDAIRIAITARIVEGSKGRCSKADLESLLARIQQRTKDTIAP